jgi:hypothetical protein
MSNIILQVDLGQNLSLTTSPTQMIAPNTRALGRFCPRININQTMFLQNRPSNNIFNVKLIDNITNLVSTDDFEYVIQLYFEKIE